TLADRIAQGPMGWREAAAVFLAIARGLEAAHERGIVHRDLKPANVKVRIDDASGEAHVKVLDFGLAKAMDIEAASGAPPALEDSPTLTLAATLRGEVLGTAGYMAPEQARGTAVDKRADVWAFGVCLFEALTGRPTFDGDTLSDRLASVLKEEPDWSLLPGDVPRRLVDLLRRCLVKPTADRLRDIGEARIALADLVANPDPQDADEPADDSARTARRRGFRPATFAAALAAVALVSAAATWLATRGRADSGAVATTSGPVRFSIGAADGGPLPDVGGVLISPDGRRVVYAGGSSESEGLVVGSDVGREPLRIRALDGFDESIRVLEGTEGALYPFFSPDSEWVGFFRGGGGVRTLYRVNLETGAVLPITTGTHPGYRVDWSDDGKLVMGEQRGSLRRVDVATGSLEPHFTRVDTAGGETGHVHPEVLPEGRGVIFVALEAQQSSTRIRVWDARTDETRTLVARGGEARYLPSGHLLYGLDGGLFLVDFDLETLTTVGEPRSIVQGVVTGSLGEAYFDVSDDGTLVYLPGSGRQVQLLSLVWVRPDGTIEEELAQGDILHPQISPDGRRWLARSARTELALFDRGTPVPQRFQTEVPIVMPPLLTADGSAVLYGNYTPDLRARLFRLDLVSGRSTELTGRREDSSLPVVLDEERGETIGVVMSLLESGARNVDLVAGSLDGEAPVRELVSGRTPGSGAGPTGARLSPDGDRLAYALLADPVARVSTLYVAEYPGMERRLPISENLEDNGYAWGEDGRLWYSEASDNTMRVVSFSEGPDLAVSSIDVAFSNIGRFWPERGFAVAPDGRILMVRASREVGGLSGRIHVIVGWAREEGLLPP
ncbi:MAG: serine/threonine-protein kinase, partial [Thermoanaerobaculia bacterium]|nr:serine/threonine-protein kinase [Thermoanaerobaculia bacterium]